MNIVVCVKQVPDTTAKKDLNSSYLLNRAEVDSVINPFDEYAIEEALQLKEQHGGEVTILTMGPESAQDVMRKALAMGGDKGMLVTDPALVGTDWYGTSLVLSKALERLDFDLVLTGMESTDARTGMLPGGLAEHLGLPLLTYASRVEIENGAVRINRQIAGGYQEVEAQLPAVVSIVKGANEPRYPSLKGIMAAKRKEIQKVSLSDLQVNGAVGLDEAKTHVSTATARGEKSPGEVMTPETPEEAAKLVADFLERGKFI